MSVALPALAIFLVALPGIIAIGSFQSELHSGQFKSWSITKQTAYGLVLAVGLHFIWLQGFGVLGIDDFDAARFIVGLSGGTEATTLMSAVVSAPGDLFAYFVSLYAFAWIAATLSRILVNATGVHRHFPFLRYHDWYYVLRGELESLKGGFTSTSDVSGVYGTALVNQGEVAYLYRGLVVDFDLDEHGTLERLYLANAHRRLLADDVEAREDSSSRDAPDRSLVPHHDERYHVIHGDLLVIEYDDVKTLNVERITLEPVTDGGAASDARESENTAGLADGDP